MKRYVHAAEDTGSLSRLNNILSELRKYTLGKKNTEKVEISVLQLNRVIKALEQNLFSTSQEPR